MSILFDEGVVFKVVSLVDARFDQAQDHRNALTQIDVLGEHVLLSFHLSHLNEQLHHHLVLGGCLLHHLNDRHQGGNMLMGRSHQLLNHDAHLLQQDCGYLIGGTVRRLWLDFTWKRKKSQMSLPGLVCLDKRKK